MAKKKMTKAQAASARREETPEAARRAEMRQRTRLIKQSAANAQKQASKSAGFRAILPFLIIVALVVLALVFTIGPGMILGK